MENTNKSAPNSMLNTVVLTSFLAFSAGSFAEDESNKDKEIKTELTEVENNKDKEIEAELTEVEKASQERLHDKKGRGRYKKVTISEDKSYYTIDGKEELGPNPVDGETFFVKYSREKYEYWGEHDDDGINYRIRNFNDRDGFYLAYSAVSSSGDDFYQSGDQSNASFDTHFSYRIQFLSLFVESPGLNSRRLHGLYASNAWGINFYNNDNWSFDIYKQTNTKKVEGLAEIQNRNEGKRAGIRATGYFDNSQLQFIYSPYSSSGPKEDGIEASLSYTHYWQVKNWNIYGSIGAQYQSEEVADFYYPDASTDQSRVNTSAELGLEYALNEHWVLGGFASYNELPSQRSDIQDATTGSRAGLLLTFVF
ncbi:MipA/OmpV family protein [Psychrosphaera sp. B3R10]|uniref:MipA/OmpV family protein n=1 Tax=unclassified Psychrosphaera TaxID=2641570 RepID=UPI001C08769B|nr:MULTISPECIES: MipA/OmpV family protein [unclassified Psychrosphaera]MBU2880426.1 MipA/OmpV family protein [Psychrosphaera sp. I2R16]MBU2987865.1 MipA/OmpV family protein [Psychrosphaera sp. B3R10]MDO6720624.1 MipA/OmpV family protein [Psychrosphaera sp. 1_MG-2023]